MQELNEANHPSDRQLSFKEMKAAFLKSSSTEEPKGDMKGNQDCPNILIVESDERFLKKLSSMLDTATLPDNSTVQSLNISRALDLRSAIDTLEQNHFDVILTDVNLADASGFLVLEELLAFGKGTPIIILSNITNWSFLIQTAQVGISDFLLKKSLNIDILMRSIFYAIERKKLEFKASHIEKLYRSLVEILPIGLARIDVDGVLNYVNDVIAQMVECVPEKLIGVELWDSFKGLGFSINQHHLQKVFKYGETTEFNLTTETPDQNIKHYHFVATPITGNEDVVVGAQCILVDITKQMVIQQELDCARSLHVLQSGVGKLAHELNNSLTPILLDAQNLKSIKDLSSQINLPVRRIERSVEKARSVLRPFLFSSQKVGPRSELININKVLDGLIQEHLVNVPANVKFECQFDTCNEPLKSDSSLLCKMLINLFNNATESMPDGGLVRLKLSKVALDESSIDLNSLELKPGPYLLFTVSDQGAGIPPHLLQRVFEPFYTTKPKPHKGIGLTETLGIIKGHHGAIQLDSRIHVGTNIRLYLPLTIEPLKTVPLTRSTCPLPPHEKRNTILLVDDDENILESAQALIEHLGFQVMVAKNGAEALNLFTQRQSDILLVITDFEMPIMNGPSLIKALREISPSLRIILCTGLEAQESVDQIVGLEVNATLFKPFKAKMLEVEIKRQLTS